MLDAQLPQRPEAYDSLANDNDDIRKQLKEIQDQSFQQLRDIYMLARGEAQLWSLVSIIIAVLGIVCILVGAFVSFNGNTPFGVLAAIASILEEATAVLIFRQSKGSWKRLDEIYKEAGKRVDETSKILQEELQKQGEVLREKERLERASKFVLEIPDKETQNRLKVAIFWQILGASPVRPPETPSPVLFEQPGEDVEN